ncbi:MAG TPA: type II toxin-antitoxin system PemK/MazF family toxin [Candidatus Limnocylindrales bacterium]|nr:type II toxin-antitoxin system PemK/MazF family toxin [Candidatus Limnocylindrales bacterium]
MTPFKVGDVVSVEFPFSDFQTYKRRLGLVLISSEMDLLVARLTTHPPREPSDVALKHWSEIGLPRASTIRLTKLVTLDHRLVHHKIGRLHSDDGRAVVQAWQQMTTAFAAELLK